MKDLLFNAERNTIIWSISFLIMTATHWLKDSKNEKVAKVTSKIYLVSAIFIIILATGQLAYMMK